MSAHSESHDCTATEIVSHLRDQETEPALGAREDFFGDDSDAAHEGRETVGHDPDSALMRAVRANGLPYLVVFDAEGSIAWTHRGLASEENLRAAVEDVA